MLLMKEYLLMSTINHQKIPKIYGFNLDNFIMYLQFCEGQTLESYIMNKK